MITIAHARELLNSNRFDPEIEHVPLQRAVGRVLAIDVFSDRALPPFDRVSMDGIAVSAADLDLGIRTFRREAHQFAGESARFRSDEIGSCIETATGAVLPNNCDTVIPYEALIESENEFILRDDAIVRPLQNVHRAGSDLAAGERILQLGREINAAAIAALASVGYAQVPVFSLPRTALVSTGDELVAVNQFPLPHQIRQSNAHTIHSLLLPMGIHATHFHLDDDRDAMLNWLNSHQQRFDLIIFSGGVSMGKKDFLPEVLAEIGIEKHFHKVSQRPGKPLWFGSKKNLHVFGLPGNPVSTFLSVIVHVRLWIANCYPTMISETEQVALGETVDFAPELTLFQPVILKNEGGTLHAYPVRGNGSGDYHSLINCTGVIELPAERTRFERGEIVHYTSFSWRKN